MRIVGYIPHPVMKITVFTMNMKYSVKLEMGQMEQTYKISESEDIKGLEDISRLLDDTLLDESMELFDKMHTNISGAFKRFSDTTK
jgi:hypothetical protein